MRREDAIMRFIRCLIILILVVSCKPNESNSGSPNSRSSDAVSDKDRLIEEAEARAAEAEARAAAAGNSGDEEAERLREEADELQRELDELKKKSNDDKDEDDKDEDEEDEDEEDEDEEDEDKEDEDKEDEDNGEGEETMDNNYKFAIESFEEATLSNNAGETPIPLGDLISKFCVISAVSMQNINEPDEEANCKIDIASDGNQRLIASIQGNGTNADVECATHCLTWDNSVLGREYPEHYKYSKISVDDEEVTKPIELTGNTEEYVFCGLAEVGFRDIDTNNESTACWVGKNEGAWEVTAIVEQGSGVLRNTKNADARCAGTCLISNADSGLKHQEDETNVVLDGAGTMSRDLAEEDNHFCFLTKVKFSEIERDNEDVRCQVSLENGRWELKIDVSTNRNGDGSASAECSAQCVTWP